MKKVKYIVLITFLITISCKPQNYYPINEMTQELWEEDINYPKESLSVNSSGLKLRQLQSRSYSEQNEKQMLNASVEVLQDMGFIIQESDPNLGVITADKKREIENKFIRYTQIFLCILAGSSTYGIEKTHVLRTSITTTPQNNSEIKVRVNFQREIFDIHDNLVGRQSIHEEKIYNGFFSKLSKSLFLEENNV